MAMHMPPKIKVKLVRIENAGQNQDEQDKRDYFCNGGNQVDLGRLLHTAQDQEIKAPDEKRSPDNGIQIIAPCKNTGEEIIQGIHGNDRIAHIPKNLTKPIAPPDVKAHIGTKPGTSVHVNP